MMDVEVEVSRVRLARSVGVTPARLGLPTGPGARKRLDVRRHSTAPQNNGANTVYFD
jgi:hypothetical protein